MASLTIDSFSPLLFTMDSYQLPAGEPTRSIPKGKISQEEFDSLHEASEHEFRPVSTIPLSHTTVSKIIISPDWVTRFTKRAAAHRTRFSKVPKPKASTPKAPASPVLKIPRLTIAPETPAAPPTRVTVIPPSITPLYYTSSFDIAIGKLRNLPKPRDRKIVYRILKTEIAFGYRWKIIAKANEDGTFSLGLKLDLNNRGSTCKMCYRFEMISSDHKIFMSKTHQVYFQIGGIHFGTDRREKEQLLFIKNERLSSPSVKINCYISPIVEGLPPTAI